MHFNLDEEIEKFQSQQLKKFLLDLKNGSFFKDKEIVTYNSDKICIDLNNLKKKYILQMDFSDLIQTINTKTKLFWDRTNNTASCPAIAATNNSKIRQEFKSNFKKAEAESLKNKQAPEEQIKRLIKNKDFINQLISSILTDGYFIISHYYIEQFDLSIPQNFNFAKSICKKLKCQYIEIEDDPSYSDIQYKLFFENNAKNV